MTLPLSLRGKYQLVLLGAAGSSSVDACASRLDNALKVAFAHLGVNVDKFLVRIRAGMTDPDINRRMLSVSVYFGLTPSPSLSPSDEERLGHLLTDGSLIIPVVVDTASFGMLVPPQEARLQEEIAALESPVSGQEGALSAALEKRFSPLRCRAQ